MGTDEALRSRLGRLNKREEKKGWGGEEENVMAESSQCRLESSETWTFSR